MPELPEVETVARGLRNVLPGTHILGVRLGKTDFIEDSPAIEQVLPGSRIGDVRRYGKFLLLDLQPADTSASAISLLIHLGMTGQIVVCPPDAPVAPHTHVFLTLDNGREFRYTDIRRFGSIKILADGARKILLDNLGIDPLEATKGEFVAELKTRRTRIKALLLDQSVLSGLGNIYTDESLWRARIHPMRLAAKLNEEELHRLYRAIREVLKEAIRFRGSSISDYVDSEGNQGSFQLRHRVYQRKGKKCFRCGTAVDRVIVAGRSSYFCPHCQSAPRKSRGLARGPRKCLKGKGASRRGTGIRR